MTDEMMDEMDELAAGEPEFDVIEAEPQPRLAAAAPSPRKPVLCLMGEFSAGKSTLSNLLLETRVLPVNVTATQLPPVWISFGDEAPYRLGMDGAEYDVDLDNLEAIKVEDTQYIRIFHDAPLLEKCDLIDMPGISDPNMDAEVWQRVIHHANAVIWCTHATQAWRQSEAAVWSMLPDALYANSLLLLTRMDKILTDRDRGRVVKRVAKETEGLFRELCPISLTQALAGRNDPARWAASGAQDFTEALDRMLDDVSQGVAAGAPRDEADIPLRSVVPARVQPRRLEARQNRSRLTDAQDGRDAASL